MDKEIYVITYHGMYYLNTKHIASVTRNWHQLIDIIKQAVFIMGAGEFAQPVKPYLRYRDMANRIIAMPAFIGGTADVAGIKWIASFPENIRKGLKRAHSVTILNEAGTGIPICLINTSLVSEIRTAAVSGLVMKKFLEHQPGNREYTVGMTGFGPIGKMHLEMISFILKDRMKEYRIYDIKGVDDVLLPGKGRDKIKVCQSFEEAYEGADIFITATVSQASYISKAPARASLHLNVSLRDYESRFIRFVDKMLVDDWDEVCRENTDIQKMYLKEGLQKEQTFSLVELFCTETAPMLSPDEVVMFNPMGMAVFDMAIGEFYYRTTKENNIGYFLED